MKRFEHGPYPGTYFETIGGHEWCFPGQLQQRTGSLLFPSSRPSRVQNYWLDSQLEESKAVASESLYKTIHRLP